ncbi:MAG TPA: ComEA family DNA-binding protein [Cellvibrionaceae bacterium]|nr:ComEA family DNA-binding protein [Cellvibrionaceae bacterium]HMW46968.1 ComEA family DNA-binding protein [Cellvibrionaceae bacterium]HMW71275.1 ComEA family DNA-binding protein [Cellvibrionaceae bacterium]HMY40441.1 ComEA family DNA-binding protein [Marinagarivorans sp.]HNG61106.1 ComEA family DNA-binding protein [Cellvibrionaceae bacterium]
MNIAKMYKAMVRSVGAAGMTAALMLPVTAFAVEKPTVEPKTQEVKSAEAKLKDGSAKEQAAVNINTADAATLAAGLNGIGIKKAEAIVAYREQNGKFTSADQLLEVKGIGKATLDKNRDKIKI